MPLRSKGARKGTKSQRPTRPRLIGVKLVLYIVCVLLGAFSVVQWAVPLWPINRFFAVFIGAVFGASALVTPAVIGLFSRAGGFSRALLGAIIIVFGAVDCIGLSIAFQRYEETATQPAWDAAIASHAQARQTPLAAVTAAQARLDAIVLDLSDQPGPQTTAARTEAWKVQRAEIAPELETARAELASWDAAHPQPARPDLYDDQLIWILSGALQVALAIAFATIEGIAGHMHRKALADWQAEQDRKEKAKIDRINAQARLERAKAKPAKPAEPEPAPAADEETPEFWEKLERDLMADRPHFKGPILVHSSDW